MWVHANGTLRSSIRNYLIGAGPYTCSFGQRKGVDAFNTHLCTIIGLVRVTLVTDRPCQMAQIHVCNFHRGRMKDTTLRPPPTPLSSHAPQAWLSSEMPLGGYGFPLPDANKFEASFFPCVKGRVSEQGAKESTGRIKEGQRKSTC